MKMYKVYSPGGRFGIATDPMTAQELTDYLNERPGRKGLRVETVEVEDTKWSTWIESWNEHRLD